MLSPLDILLCSAILGGWTFIWLTWMFRGDVRAWLAAATFPWWWLGETKRLELADMSPLRFTKWLTLSSTAPSFFRNLLSCHYCCSAHVAGAGAILMVVPGWLPLTTLPFAWAGGAAIGIILYDHTYRQRPDPH